MPERDRESNFSRGNIGGKSVKYSNTSMENLNAIMNRIDSNYNLVAKNYLNKKPMFK